MKCFFDKDKECPFSSENIESKAKFCQACVTQEGIAFAKSSLIMALLRMFPQDEEKAKEQYQKLMKRTEEW